MTEDLDVLFLLTDGATITRWNNEKLPSDRMSVENATILTNAERWPLMIGSPATRHQMDQDTRGGSIADSPIWTEGVRKKILRLLDYSVTYHAKRHSNKLTDFVLFSKSHYN